MKLILTSLFALAFTCSGLVGQTFVLCQNDQGHSELEIFHENGHCETQCHQEEEKKEHHEHQAHDAACAFCVDTSLALDLAWHIQEKIEKRVLEKQNPYPFVYLISKNRIDKNNIVVEETPLIENQTNLIIKSTVLLI